ncbi:hypothetical protein D3C71_1564410 [compost metagenome]
MNARVAEFAADFNHVFRVQEVERPVVLHRHHHAFLLAVIYRFQNVYRHPGITAAVRLFDKLLERQHLTLFDFTLAGFALHVGVFPRQIVSEIDAESLIQLRGNIQPGKVGQHLLVYQRNLFATGFSGIDDGGDRLFPVIVVIQILIEHQVIGQRDQLWREIFHAGITV